MDLRIAGGSLEGCSQVTGPAGTIALRWRGGHLIGVDLVSAGLPDDPLPRSLTKMARLIADPRSATGPEVPLSLLAGGDSHGFAWKILTTLRRRVPPGRVVSYGRLAGLAGASGAARAVARVMATNPFPLVFPCHRVVCSDGAIGGFMRGRRGGVARKVALLATEGVQVVDGRVLDQYLV